MYWSLDGNATGFVTENIGPVIEKNPAQEGHVGVANY
jgi:hypothetical protein